MLQKHYIIYVSIILLIVVSQCYATGGGRAPASNSASKMHTSTSTSTMKAVEAGQTEKEKENELDHLPLAKKLAWENTAVDSAKVEQVNKNSSDAKPTQTVTGNKDIKGINSGVVASNTQPRAPLMTGCRTHGQIAVTYSEGPSDATARIVRHLNNADARANFFFNSSWLYTQQYAMVVQNIYNAGHFIGMTYRVKDDDSSLWSDQEIREDIINNARIIETLIKVSPKYVRLHYTPKPDLRVESILNDLGFVLVGYNLDSQDYSHKDPTGPNSIEDVYRRTFQRQKDTYDAKGSFISIQYDIPDTGALVAVPFMINTINEEGYTMVRLDGCLNDPKPYKKSANSKEYVSDHFSFNATDYHQGQKAIAPEALIVDNWETEEDRMFLKKKSNSMKVTISQWLSSMLMAALLGIMSL